LAASLPYVVAEAALSKFHDQLVRQAGRQRTCYGAIELYGLIVRKDVAAWIAQQLLDSEQSPAASAVGGEPAVCGGGGGFEQIP
jgi:hypothetical protein